MTEQVPSQEFYFDDGSEFLHCFSGTIAAEPEIVPQFCYKLGNENL